MINELPDNWQKASADHEKKYKNFLQRPDRKKVLRQLPELHEEAFEKIDCPYPMRIAAKLSDPVHPTQYGTLRKKLKLRPGNFTEKYLSLA